MPEDKADVGTILTDEYFITQFEEKGLFYKSDLISDTINELVTNLVSREIAARYSIMPIFEDGAQIVLVTSKAQSFKEQRQIETDLGRSVKLLLGKEENVKSALNHYYEISSATYHRSVGNKTLSVENMDPLKQQVQKMLQLAVKRKASDIHLLPYEDGMFVHFRINGHLMDFSEDIVFRPEESPFVVNIIKGMDESGQADPSASTMPNQGSFSLNHGETLIDVRLSTVPLAVKGLQKVVLRLLPQVRRRADLSGLGYRDKELADIRAALLKSSTGIFILSGPTGAGKTTSIYAQIYEDNNMLGEYQNVFTIENPVEIREPLFCQVQVREAKDEDVSFTAEKILETAMRQDPNVILYGEMRSANDVTVAVNAAQTGHKVFSTVHAKDCVATISRLLDLGASRSSLLREINIIMNQRLVGILCDHCSKNHILTDLEKSVLTEDELMKLSKAKLRERGSLQEIKVCPHCRGGYKHRIAVLEYIPFDMELRDALLDPNIRFSMIKDLLNKHEFRSMWDKGMDLVACGATDLMEILHQIGKPE